MQATYLLAAGNLYVVTYKIYPSGIVHVNAKFTSTDMQAAETEVSEATRMATFTPGSDAARKAASKLEVPQMCIRDRLNMAQQGVFGEVLHVEGAYIHNLEDFWPYYWNNWRMDYNQKHRGDVYATHGMGPACQVLNIHRGDRMKTLVAMDTKAVNGPAYIKKSTGKEVKDFQNGDQTTTLILSLIHI